MDSQDHKTTTKTTSDETAAAPAPDRGAARLEPDGSLLLTGLSLAPVPRSQESRCAPTMTTCPGCSVPLISATVFHCGTESFMLSVFWMLPSS